MPDFFSLYEMYIAQVDSYISILYFCYVQQVHFIIIASEASGHVYAVVLYVQW